MDLPAKMRIYDKFFSYYHDDKLDAYYNIEFLNYSENLGREQYLCHIILLQPLKITNYSTIFKIETIALQSLFSTNSEIIKEESIFSLIVEFTEGAKFIPDLNMIRNINKNKIKIEDTHNVTLNHAIAIIPKKFGKTFKLFKFIVENFSKDKKRGIVVGNYEEALEEIKKIDFIIDSKQFEKIVS